MDRWAWDQLDPWLEIRRQLPIGALLQPGFVTEMLAALTVRYPSVPIHFAETRPLAEEWTYRFLGAALAYYQADRT